MFNQRKSTSAANAIIVFAAFLTYSWNPLIDGAAQFLIRPDAPRRSDLIFLLGGDYLARSPYAAYLLVHGYSPQILVAREASDMTDKSIDLMIALGAEARRIVQVRPTGGVHSTADEARALRRYVRSHSVKSVLVVTSMLHSRRAKMAIQRALWGTGVDVRVVCVGSPVYAPSQQSDAKLEGTKLVYYFFTFWG